MYVFQFCDRDLHKVTECLHQTRYTAISKNKTLLFFFKKRSLLCLYKISYCIIIFFILYM